MPHGQRSQDSNLEEGQPGQSSTQVLMGVQGLKEEEEADTTVSSTSSSSHVLIGDTPKEESGPETPSCPQNSETIYSPPPMSKDSSQCNESSESCSSESSEGSSSESSEGSSSECSESSSRQEAEGPSPSQDMNIPQILRSMLLNEKIHNLVPLLFCKYQKKERITMEEILHIVDEDYREHFPLIFREFCECMCVGLGMDMSEVDPPGHTYELVPVMGLTYKGILDDEDKQVIAKVDLLILILSVIFIKGNRISEEELRKQVKRWETLAKMEQIVIGDPWKFITEDLVREEYLVNQQVPDSDPARYEFLWGSRAHAETTQMKILERMAKLNKMDPRSYPHLYAEALKEEKGTLRAPEEQDA
ncbi:PREDICTED: melanoma-associated antigen 10-like [Chinchilla lanigera]|uniref:melanoma-associated antigen 10-like n=1 Tax=Chinchilla lanigera TaxID=34839 RepID=UPI000697F8B1|nr:PREDICTED: melanoma-associated antigen 10-like [Chinchilla lanigera]